MAFWIFGAKDYGSPQTAALIVAMRNVLPRLLDALERRLTCGVQDASGKRVCALGRGHDGQNHRDASGTTWVLLTKPALAT